MSTEMISRKYALTKVSAGDWLLPSNDGRTVWRITTYEDGPSHGLMDWDRDRTFWGVWKWHVSVDLTSHGYVDVEDWERWEFHEGYHETRADAIKAALR